MRIYYVIPPHGVNQYKSMADAQAAFEAGERWECVGEAIVNAEGKITGIEKYPETKIPMRYSECHQIRHTDEDGAETVVAVPKAFAMQWAPGRVALLQYRIQAGEYTVGAQHGNVAMGGKGAVQHKKLNPMKPVNRPASFIRVGLSVLDGKEPGQTGSGLLFRMSRKAPVPDGPVWERPHHDEGMTFMEWASRVTPYTASDWALDRYYASRKAAAGGYHSLNLMGELTGTDSHNGKRKSSDDHLDPYVKFELT